MNILIVLVLLFTNGCTRTCFLQEVPPGGAEYATNNYRYKESGIARYQSLLRKLHQDGKCSINSGPSSKVNVFKLRFCNYMLGFRNDDKKELIALAKEISDYYKKIRMYDFARTFDSYRDVLLYGNETIAESWDDTMDLLEAFHAEIERKRKEEKCRIEKEKKRNEPSFFSKIFGSSSGKNTDNCNCNWIDSPYVASDKVAVPNILSEPPGSCSSQKTLLFKRTPTYDQCFGAPPTECDSCPHNGSITAKTYKNSDQSVEAAMQYIK